MRRVSLFPPRRMLCPILIVGMLCAAVAGVDAAPSAAALSDAVVAPSGSSGAAARHPGYVLGDLIEQRAVLEAPRGFMLDRASLPQLRRVNVWLTLLHTSVRDLGGAERRYEIGLRYQLVNAPLKVRSIELPDVHIRFTWRSSAGPGRSSAASALDGLIEGQRVTIAPLLPAHMPMSAHLMRPDHVPGPLSTLPERLAAGLAAGLAGAILAAFVAAPILRRRNGPFARACRRIRREIVRAELARAGAPRVYREALRALHRAFDQTAGWTLFPDRLGAFVVQQRRFADIRGDVERFLQMSQREFFECRGEPGSSAAGDSERSALHWLLGFALECRARERRPA